MPLRKQGTIVSMSAAAALAFAAAVPTTASAYSWYPASPTPTPAPTATPAPTPAPTPTPAPSSSTTTTPTTPTGCTALPTTQAFSKYNDAAQYFLAPGGSFETGTPAWTLTSGAKIVSGNDGLGITSGSKALQLPVGGTALSPAFCVDDSLPSFRFSAKISSLDGGFAAIVVYRNEAGDVTKAQFLSSAEGTYWNGANTWSPSPVSPLATKIPLLSSSGTTASVQLMFVGTTKSYGAWVGSTATIDSVMVDPYRRG